MYASVRDPGPDWEPSPSAQELVPRRLTVGPAIPEAASSSSRATMSDGIIVMQYLLDPPERGRRPTIGTKRYAQTTSRPLVTDRNRTDSASGPPRVTGTNSERRQTRCGRRHRFVELGVRESLKHRPAPRGLRGGQGRGRRSIKARGSRYPCTLHRAWAYRPWPGQLHTLRTSRAAGRPDLQHRSIQFREQALRGLPIGSTLFSPLIEGNSSMREPLELASHLAPVGLEQLDPPGIRGSPAMAG